MYPQESMLDGRKDGSQTVTTGMGQEREVTETLKGECSTAKNMKGGVLDVL